MLGHSLIQVGNLALENGLIFYGVVVMVGYMRMSSYLSENINYQTDETSLAEWIFE